MGLLARLGIRAPERSTPSAPAAGSRLLYPKTTGWYDMDSAGIERLITTGGCRYLGAYSTAGSTFAVGDLVTNNGVLLVCTTAYSTVSGSVVGSSGVTYPGNTSVNLPLPAGAAAGDNAIIAIGYYSGGGAFVAPSYATLVRLTANSSYPGFDAAARVFTYALTSTNITAGYLTLPAQPGGDGSAAMVAYRGAATADLTHIGDGALVETSVTPSGPGVLFHYASAWPNGVAAGNGVQASLTNVITGAGPAGRPCTAVGMETYASGSTAVRTWTWTGVASLQTDRSAFGVIPFLSAGIDVAKWAVLNPAPIETYTFSITGPLATVVGKSRVYLEGNYTIDTVRAAVNTAPTGATVIVDVNKNGTTIYTTQGSRPAIATSGFSATGSAPDITTFVSGDYLTVDLDQVGSTIAGSDLTVTVRLRKTS